jgi:hypothetical protein
MNTATENVHYELMRREMVSSPPPFIPEFEVGGGSSILDQMDRAFQRGAMLRYAMMAAGYLAAVVDDTPEKIEEAVRDFSKLSLIQHIDQRDETSMALAVGAAAIMMAARHGLQTALEKIDGAIAILSERYQADW